MNSKTPLSLDNIEIPQELQTIITIQRSLANLDSHNIESIFIWIKKCPFFTDPYLIQEMSRQFIILPTIRPCLIEIITDLAASLCKHSILFKETLLHEILFEKMDCAACPHLFRRLYIRKIFNLNEVLEILKHPARTRFLLFFSPEIEDLNLLKKGFDYYFLGQKLTLNDLKKNNWEILFDYFDYGWSKNHIIYSIKYDILDLFQEFTIDSHFDFNKKYLKSKFEIMRICESYSLIEYSALFRSIQCFKFLLLNNVNLNDNLFKCSVAGGNLDIILLIKNYNLNFENCFQAAVTFRHCDIINWLIENGIEQDLVTDDCIESNNLHAALYTIQQNPEIPLWSSFCASIRTGYSGFAIYLLSIGLNINDYISQSV